MFYDPLISKLVVHAETREAAIARMLRAVSEYRVTGIEDDVALLRSRAAPPEVHRR